MKIAHFLQTNSNRITLIILLGIIITMLIDLSLARVYDLIAKQPTSIWRITIFAGITSICIFASYFILLNAKKRSAGIRSVAKLHIGSIHQITRITQFAIIVLLVILIFQTVLNQRYSMWLMTLILWIAYGVAILMLGLLAKRLFSWGIHKKNATILLYAFASTSLSVSAGFSLVYVNDILVDRPQEILPYSAGSMVSIVPYSERAMLNSAFFVSSVVSFSILWLATAALLHHYSAKLGAIRYWALVAAPLVFFLGQFIGFTRLFDPLLATDPVAFAISTTLIFTLSKPIGGILFGIAFYTMARNLRQNSALSNYLMISSLGFVLLFVADHASVLLVAPFPPFGLASVSLTGLASYLILLGIYSSVISISEDASLRRSLRNATLGQSRLLDTMASAHIIEEMQRKASSVMKDSADKLAKITGIDSSRYEDDWKQYIDEIMSEMTSKKRNSKTEDSANDVEDQHTSREVP